MSHKAAFITGKQDLLTADTQARIDHWVAKFPPENKRSALIQALLTQPVKEQFSFSFRQVRRAQSDEPLDGAVGSIFHFLQFIHFWLRLLLFMTQFSFYL